MCARITNNPISLCMALVLIYHAPIAWGQEVMSVNALTVGASASHVETPEPRSLHLPSAFDEDNRVVTEPLPVEDLLAEDELRLVGPRRTGLVQEFPAITGNDGRWTQLDDGGWLWTVSFRAPGARGIRLRIRPWAPPWGAELLLYNAADLNEVRGPLTSSYKPASGTLWTQIIYGEEVLLEYYLPPGIDHRLPASQIVVDGLVNMYWTIGGGVTTSGELPCHIDVSCRPNWQETADGVAALSFLRSRHFFSCTAAMLNREGSDQTPILMTATHCGVDETNADTVLATWFYQTPSCNGDPPEPDTLPQTLGCVLLRRQLTTDWTLIGLTDDVPSGVTFLGWTSRRLGIGDSVVGIHHPRGSHKRYASGIKWLNAGNRALIDQDTCVSSTFHLVRWHDDGGLVERASSGSPLFDSSQRVRGTLSCAESSCDATNWGTYGRLDQAFDGLRAYLNSTDPIYVDVAHGGRESGTEGEPFNTVKEGTFAIRRGSTMFIESGSYNERMTIGKAMTLEARNGGVVIGR